MNLFRWLYRPSKQRDQTKSEACIRRVVKSFRLPVVEGEPGMWSVVGERHDTYRVSLHLWAQDHMIHLMAGSELVVERDLLPQELAFTLLEENHRCEEGSFRLVPQEENRLVVLGRVIDARSFPEAQMCHLGETLIEKMQRMINKLYAMGLIISGNEESEDKPSKRKKL